MKQFKSYIPSPFPRANYHVTVLWRDLEKYLESQMDASDGMAALDLDPDFQRAHVWTPEQQSAYVEYILRGGESGKSLYFNCAGWMGDWRGPYVIVDGKQRLQAVRQWLNNQIPTFGMRYAEFGARVPSDFYFDWHVASLSSRIEVLRWYLDFNSAGTQHTPEELDRVRVLLEAE